MFYVNIKFLRLQGVLQMCTFGSTLGPIHPLKESKIEKSKYFQKKIIHRAIHRAIFLRYFVFFFPTKMGLKVKD